MKQEQQQTVCIKAIIGLGNPGHEFEKTRHNIGFCVVDHLVEKHHAANALRVQDQFVVGKISVGDRQIVVVKPLTYMNASGKAIPFLKRQGIQPNEVLVVHDELELPFGKIATRFGGSARGHNGLKSLISQAGSDFWRVRCGVGRPPQGEEVSDYVLSTFREPKEQVAALIEQAGDAVEKMLEPC
jgi:peptidyl-tRNA hydrolase, PTH1 family